MFARLVLLAALLFPAAVFAQPLPAPATVVGPRVALQTSAGKIVLELYPDKAPRTVENFLSYVRDGHYNGTVFHRVIADLLLQGGAFTPDMQQKPERAPIASEANNGLSNLRGTIAAARRARKRIPRRRSFSSTPSTTASSTFAPTPAPTPAATAYSAASSKAWT